MGLPNHFNEHCYPKMMRVLRVHLAVHHQISNFFLAHLFLERLSYFLLSHSSASILFSIISIKEKCHFLFFQTFQIFLKCLNFAASFIEPSVAPAGCCSWDQKISPNFTSYYTFYFPALHICTLVTKMNVNIFLFILQE